MCITLYQLLLPKLYYIACLSAGNLIRESGNPANFNKEASEKYMKLSAQEKLELKDRAENQPTKRLSRSKVLLEGEKLFKKIQKLVRFSNLYNSILYTCRSLHVYMHAFMHGCITVYLLYWEL